MSKTMSAADLGRLSVEQARETRRKLENECGQKQEELRELVGVRYKDFIEAADTIAAMGSSAKEIIKIAVDLGDLSASLLSASWNSVPHEPQHDVAIRAQTMFQILHSSERVSGYFIRG